MQVEDDNGNALIKQLEAKRGGSITWKSYSIYYADSDGRIIENGVFVYKINDIYWLEDFEKVPSIFGMRINNPRNYSYEKFERCFSKEEIAFTRTVLKKDVIKYIEHRAEDVPAAGKVKAFFGEPILMIKFTNGKALFLHLLDASVFEK